MHDDTTTSRKLGYHHGTKTECVAARTDLVHTCFYGSECIDASNNYGLLDRYCDCDTADTLVAGLMCQYEATSICMVDGDNNIEQVTDQYCVNDGQCASLVDNGESHPGCICEVGVWEGTHCEYAHGALLDDALDLFQQRKAGIVVETRGDIPTSPTLADTTTTSGGDGELGLFDELSNELGVPLILIVGMFIAVLTVIPLSVIAIRMSRKIQQQHDDDDDYQSVISFSSSSSSSTKGMEHVPSDVFMTSRKKEAESSDDDNNSMMLTPGTQDDLEEETCDVEMLDAETSRMIEAQFEHCGEADCDRESLELELSNEGNGSVSLYNDNMKPASQLLRRRIAISCGGSSVRSKVQAELSPKIDIEECSIESEVSGSDKSTNQRCGVVGGGVTSLEDGDDLDEGVHFV